MAVLPDVIGQTIGSMAASRMQQANRPRVDAKDQASAGGYYVDADSMPIEESPTGIRYFVQPGELVGGGQPTARRGFWGRQYDRFLKPIVDPVVSALGRAFRGGIDYTREATGAAYVALSNEITELEEVIVTGVRQTQNNVRQTWTDFSQAWSIQPQRRPLGETFFSPAPPSNPITWLNSDIGVRQAIVRDEQADADGLNAMRSVTNPWATNAGLSVRSGLERLHAGFANVFAVPFGVIDAGPGRLAEAGGLRWKSSENVTGHMMAEPTIMVGSVFIGNPQAIAGGMAPKAISIGRAEVLAVESVPVSRLAQGLELEAGGAARAQVEAFLPGQSTQRLSVRAFNANGTLAEGRTVLDVAGARIDDGLFGALEFKLSPNAPYTPRQQLHFPLLEQYGGVVVGAKGEVIGLPAGARIAPTAPVRVNGPTLPQPGEWWQF